MFKPEIYVWAILALGCTATYESALRNDLRAAATSIGEVDAPPVAVLDGSLASYVRFASERSPELRESYERWRAATHRIAPARRFPDPMVTYGFYAAPVQTRVGPQRHRLGVRQTIPWPTRLTASADSRALHARAAQRVFEGRMLALRARVADAWWRLWVVRRSRDLHQGHHALVAGLIEAARARLEVGRAALSDVAQLELRQARVLDQHDGYDEAERAAEAGLRAAIGADAGISTPTADEVVDAALPGEALEALAEAARTHPLLEAFELRAQGHESTAEAAEAGRFPSFVLGVDWIETGEAVMPVNGSGDDALIVSLGVSVPIFGQDAAGDLARAAEADGAAERAGREAAERLAVARLTEAWSTLQDAHRRLELFRTTLVPQARAVYESVTSTFATSERSVASSLAAQQTLLTIELDVIRERSRHGVAVSRIEALAGRPLLAGGAR